MSSCPTGFLNFPEVDSGELQVFDVPPLGTVLKKIQGGPEMKNHTKTRIALMDPGLPSAQFRF